MTYEDCLRRGRLKRSGIEGNVVERTLNMAEDDICAAVGFLEREEHAWALVQSYSSMLNCARAILFNDGFVEKSHYCVVEYLRYHHYDKFEDHIERLDLMRRERHQILYDSRDTADKPKVEIRLNWAKEFIFVTKEELLRKR